MTLEPCDAAADALRAWWQARAGEGPPPTISSVWRCTPLADLPQAFAMGAQAFDVVGIVTGDAATASLDSGEVADVMMLCDQSASVRLRVVRSGEQGQWQYHDGMSLAIVAAKPICADDGHLTLVAPAANVRMFPKAERAEALYEWYHKRAAGTASDRLVVDEPAPMDTFGDQFGWESAFDFGVPSGGPPPSLPPSPPSSAPPSPPPVPPPPDGMPLARAKPPSPIIVLSQNDSPTTYYCEEKSEVARDATPVPEAEAAANASVGASSAASARKCWPLPLRPDDAVALRERSAANFDALAAASDVKFGRRHACDEVLARLESLDPSSPADLEAVLSYATTMSDFLTTTAGTDASSGVALTDSESNSSRSPSPNETFTLEVAKECRKRSREGKVMPPPLVRQPAWCAGTGDATLRVQEVDFDTSEQELREVSAATFDALDLKGDEVLALFESPEAALDALWPLPTTNQSVGECTGDSLEVPLVECPLETTRCNTGKGAPRPFVVAASRQPAGGVDALHAFGSCPRLGRLVLEAHAADQYTPAAFYS